MPCAGFTVISNTSALCELPYVEDSPLLSYGVPLMVLMVNNTPPYRFSNSFFLTFAPAAGANPSTTSSTTSNATTTIAVSVVFGVLGLIALIVVVMTLRRRRARRKAEEGLGEGERGVVLSWSRLSESRGLELSSK